MNRRKYKPGEAERCIIAGYVARAPRPYNPVAIYLRKSAVILDLCYKVLYTCLQQKAE